MNEHHTANENQQGKEEEVSSLVKEECQIKLGDKNKRAKEI